MSPPFYETPENPLASHFSFGSRLDKFQCVATQMGTSVLRTSASFELEFTVLVNGGVFFGNIQRSQSSCYCW